jgi:hypothetical protein
VADLGWIPFNDFILFTPWWSGASHALRVARFWIDVAWGGGRALRRLTRMEQDFVFAKIERQGGNPLRTSPHYPPRPPVAERFPRSRLDPARLPKVVVVTPSFQQVDFVEAALRSVLEQEGVRLDYIVQDGGSTDGTADLLRRYGPRLKAWSSEPDGGQADAIKRGFARADCGPDDVMAYLNSDDLYMPGALRFVADYFARHPKVDVVYGHRLLIDEDGLEVGRWFTPRHSCAYLRIYDLVPQETFFWRKRIWDRVGGVDPQWHFAVDWDLLLRFADAGARFSRLPRFLGAFRLHPQQKTQARMLDVGIPETDRLRERSLGRAATPAELFDHMRRAQLDSAVVAALWRRGWRL